MKVRCIRPFVAKWDGNTFHAALGQEFELPAGVDWLKAGFVEVVEQPVKPETASSKTAKRRTTRAKSNTNQ